MAILETENNNLRRRMRELEMELRSYKETQARLVEENEQLKDRLQVLAKQLQPGADGRVYERVDVTFRVDGVNSRGEASMGLARNVSAGGVFLETDLRLHLGEVMTMTFELLGRPFKLQAEVVHVIETGFGVRFYVDPQQQAALHEVITRL